MGAPVSSSSVVLSQSVLREIQQWAEKAYPHEGCGLLVGSFEKGGVKKVSQFALLTNILLTKVVNNSPNLPPDRQGEGSGKTEFLMDPNEFNRETLKAEKDGLDIVGVIHTHPDHPPRPSQVDASQPFLAQWSNIIVSVQKGEFKEMKSWFRETDSEPFLEEPISIE